MAVEAVEAPAPPTIPPPSIPDGYAQVTDSYGQLGNDAGAQHIPATLGGTVPFDHVLANSLRGYLRSSSTSSEGSLTYSDPGHPWPTNSAYASQGYQAPSARDDGCQYMEPPQPGDDIFTFGRGHGHGFDFGFGNEAANGNGNGYDTTPPPPPALVSAYDPVLAPEPSPELCIDPALLHR